MRGIIIGTVAGGLTPGGPYVSLPVVAALLCSGVGMGTMVAFLTGWSMWAVSRLPMEVGILGWKFTIIRLASTFFSAYCRVHSPYDLLRSQMNTNSLKEILHLAGLG